MAGIADTLQRWGTAASSSKLGGILYHIVCRRIDTVLIPLTKGRPSMGPPGNTVLITTTGAKSGKPRKASLAFMWAGDDMVMADLDPSIRKMCTGVRWIRSRRPELYQQLSESTGRERDTRHVRFSREDEG